MNTIAIEGKKFEVFITHDKIAIAVQKIADKMNKELKGKDVVFIGILNGAFMFVSDLLKKIPFNCKVSFLKIVSYDGDQSSGIVKNIIGLNDDISGKVVVILEDIIDSGLTIEYMINLFKIDNPADIKTAALLLKPGNFKKELKVDYFGFEIPNNFIIGYGLDYKGYGRNLQNIYKLIE